MKKLALLMLLLTSCSYVSSMFIFTVTTVCTINRMRKQQGRSSVPVATMNWLDDIMGITAVNQAIANTDRLIAESNRANQVHAAYDQNVTNRTTPITQEERSLLELVDRQAVPWSIYGQQRTRLADLIIYDFSVSDDPNAVDVVTTRVDNMRALDSTYRELSQPNQIIMWPQPNTDRWGRPLVDPILTAEDPLLAASLSDRQGTPTSRRPRQGNNALAVNYYRFLHPRDEE